MSNKNYESPVLVSWIAKNNDPYERGFGSRDYKVVDGKKIPGPTLTLLFSDESPFFNKITDVVLLYRSDDNDKNSVDSLEVKEIINEIKYKDRNINCGTELWQSPDPTEHLEIFNFLKKTLTKIRKKYLGRKLIIHISPGTPSMQTIWVLMGESGIIDPPFELVKSYRKNERHGRPAVVPVNIGIDTFYKAYKNAKPLQSTSEEQAVIFDPAKFKSSKMRDLFVEASRFARVNVPVMILGERGTGKTTLATWIRFHSPFRKKENDTTWPAVACGQYTQETMRSELFGYKKGSFTGANKNKDGLLSTANGDTLFLDEIGDVGHDLQRLLIKTIEEKIYFPLGANESVPSDFRLLTATNLEPVEFRNRLDPDFLDRISPFILTVPPLREIPEDLEWLWDEVFEKAKKRTGVDVKGIIIAEKEKKIIIKALRLNKLLGNIRDLFRIAYRIIAAALDKDSHLIQLKEIEYGLQALNTNNNNMVKDNSVTNEVAKAFYQQTTLDEAFKINGFIKTKEVEQKLHKFMAEEIRRIKKQKGTSFKDICDVTERTLLSRLNSV